MRLCFLIASAWLFSPTAHAEPARSLPPPELDARYTFFLDFGPKLAAPQFQLDVVERRVGGERLTNAAGVTVESGPAYARREVRLQCLSDCREIQRLSEDVGADRLMRVLAPDLTKAVTTVWGAGVSNLYQVRVYGLKGGQVVNVFSKSSLSPPVIEARGAFPQITLTDAGVQTHADHPPSGRLTVWRWNGDKYVCIKG